MRTVVLARNLPRSANGGADLRLSQVVAALTELGPVGVLGLHGEDDPPPRPPGVEVWRTSGVAGLTAATVPAADVLDWVRSPTGHPADRWYAPEAAADLDALVESFRPDVVIVDQLWLYRYVDERRWAAHVVLNTHNVEGALHEEMAARGEGPMVRLLAQRTALLEERAVRSVDQVWACSEADAATFARRYPEGAPVTVVPNAVDADSYSCNATRSNDVILFPGVFAYPPNARAAMFLVEQVLALLPDMNLVLAGREPTDSMRAAASSDPRVTVTGAVPDMRPLFASATLMAVPLFEGGGTRFKVLEAFAANLAVVSTAKGVQGIAAVAGEHFLLAETPTDFARQVARLLRDSDLRSRLVENAHELVRSRYSRDAVRQAVRSAAGSFQAGG